MLIIQVILSSYKYFSLQNYQLSIIKGTFRAQKNKISESGFDINIITDKIYYFDQKEQEYLPLTKSVYDSIINLNFKL